MTFLEYQQRVEALARELHARHLDRIYIPAANRLLGNIKRRIQKDGKGSNDLPLGQYSTKPGYYSKDKFVKKGAFKPSGKNGRKPSAKTMYLPGGYKELRSTQGRPSDKVNLTYTGDLMLSYKMLAKNGSILLGLDSAKEAKKKEGLEKRYGKFLQGTRKELLQYHAETREGLTQLTTETLRGIRRF